MSGVTQCKILTNPLFASRVRAIDKFEKRLLLIGNSIPDDYFGADLRTQMLRHGQSSTFLSKEATAVLKSRIKGAIMYSIEVLKDGYSNRSVDSILRVLKNNIAYTKNEFIFWRRLASVHSALYESLERFLPRQFRLSMRKLLTTKVDAMTVIDREIAKRTTKGLKTNLLETRNKIRGMLKSGKRYDSIRNFVDNLGGNSHNVEDIEMEEMSWDNHDVDHVFAELDATTESAAEFETNARYMNRMRMPERLNVADFLRSSETLVGDVEGVQTAAKTVACDEAAAAVEGLAEATSEIASSQAATATIAEIAAADTSATAEAVLVASETAGTLSIVPATAAATTAATVAGGAIAFVGAAEVVYRLVEGVFPERSKFYTPVDPPTFVNDDVSIVSLTQTESSWLNDQLTERIYDNGEYFNFNWVRLSINHRLILDDQPSDEYKRMVRVSSTKLLRREQIDRSTICRMYHDDNEPQHFAGVINTVRLGLNQLNDTPVKEKDPTVLWDTFPVSVLNYMLSYNTVPTTIEHERIDGGVYLTVATLDSTGKPVYMRTRMLEEEGHAKCFTDVINAMKESPDHFFVRYSDNINRVVARQDLHYVGIDVAVTPVYDHNGTISNTVYQSCDNSWKYVFNTLGVVLYKNINKDEVYNIYYDFVKGTICLRIDFESSHMRMAINDMMRDLRDLSRFANEVKAEEFVPHFAELPVRFTGYRHGKRFEPRRTFALGGAIHQASTFITLAPWETRHLKDVIDKYNQTGKWAEDYGLVTFEEAPDNDIYENDV